MAPARTMRGQDGEGRTLADRDAIPREYVLSFYDANDQARCAELARQSGVAEIVDSMRFGNSLRLRMKEGTRLDELLRASPAPVGVSTNYRARLPAPAPLAMEVVADPVNFGDRALDWLGVVPARDSGAGVLVAVLDTGVQENSAFPGSRVTSLSVLPAGAQTAGAWQDHGTAVASILLGTQAPVQGISPACSVLSVQVLDAEGHGDTFTLAKGIVQAVDAGARVVNMSLGSHGDSLILRQAVEYALQKGVALVAAVGNDATPEVSYPARYDGVLGVTAVDAAGNAMSFANTGPEVDIAAPGLGVAAAWTGNHVAGMSGTSISAPFVSGAIADLLAANPTMTGVQAADLLVHYASDVGAPGRDEQNGAGILDVGRVWERDIAGIYDAAAGIAFGAEGQPVVDLYVQNRGTEPLDSVALAVDVDGVKSSLAYYTLAVGATQSQSIRLTDEQIKRSGTLTLSCVTSIPGHLDANPENDARRLTVRWKGE